MKNILNAAVFIALLCPAAFADGDMGGGGFVASCDPAATVDTVGCTEGDMGGGGRMTNAGKLETTYMFLDSLIWEIL